MKYPISGVLLVVSLIAAYAALNTIDMWDGELDWFALPDEVSPEIRAEDAATVQRYGEYPLLVKALMTGTMVGVSGLSGLAAYKFTRA